MNRFHQIWDTLAWYCTFIWLCLRSLASQRSYSYCWARLQCHNKRLEFTAVGHEEFTRGWNNNRQIKSSAENFTRCFISSLEIAETIFTSNDFKGNMSSATHKDAEECVGSVWRGAIKRIESQTRHSSNRHEKQWEKRLNGNLLRLMMATIAALSEVVTSGREKSFWPRKVLQHSTSAAHFPLMTNKMH